MEFTFDLSQTPVIGRRQRPSLARDAQSTALSSTASSMYGSYSVASTATLTSAMAASGLSNISSDIASEKESIGRGTITGTITGLSIISKSTDDVNSTLLSPKRSLSLTNADSSAFSGWKRPWMSQVKYVKNLSSDGVLNVFKIIILNLQLFLHFSRRSENVW